MAADSTWNSLLTISEISLWTPTDTPGLTTFYTPPPDCSNRWFQSSSGNDVYQCGSFYDENYPIDPHYNSCIASSARTAEFSPGVCPDGHGIAEITEYQSRGSRLNWGAWCCRSGMTYRETDLLCQSTFTTPKLVFVPVTSVKGDNGNETAIYEVSSSTKVRTLTTGTAYQCPWWVEFREKDLASFPPAYATSLASRLNLAVGPTASPAFSSSLPQQTTNKQSAPEETDLSSPGSSSKLSSGAKAGIGIGALVGATFLIGIASFIILKRRRQRTRPAVMDQHDELISKPRP